MRGCRRRRARRRGCEFFVICTVYADRLMDVSPGHSGLSDVRHTKSQRTNAEKFTASEGSPTVRRSVLADPVALSLITNGTRVTHRVDPPIGSINRVCGTGRVRSLRSLASLTPA